MTRMRHGSRDCDRDACPTFTELCSVGLAFKLAHALVKRGREIGLPGAAEFDLQPLLDLVALGTIADLVPLTGENRILVSAGLQRLNTTQRPGLVALKKVGAITAPFWARTKSAFNSRRASTPPAGSKPPRNPCSCCSPRDLAEAMPLAQNLDARNRERQKIERSIVEEVIGAVRAKFNPQTDFVIVEGQLLWHIGVVGIVASRVLQEFYRPTIILGGDGEEWRGSGRSIAGFDLAAALRECDDLLVRHGGHAMAAGLSIEPDKIDALRQRLNELARRALKPEDLQPPLRLDAEVGLDEITLEMLARTGPFEADRAGESRRAILCAQSDAPPPAPAHRRGQAARQNVGDGWHAATLGSGLVEWRRRIVAGREI